ncbi:MAG: DUF6273 domain-containing protein [Blautia sp.]|nr:DUF6273 domain-containing protein [Blautia sp.]
MKKNVFMRGLGLAMALVLGLGTAGVSAPVRAEAASKTPGNPTTENGRTVWDCVYFGNYWQTKCSQADMTADAEYLTHEDGSCYRYEPIKWRVLSVDGNDAFLMADKNLDVRPYNEKEGAAAATWEDSDLRAWLNGGLSEDGFLPTAFTDAELSAIRLTDVKNTKNPWSGISGGNGTQDYVYLLSVDEALSGEYGFSSNPAETDSRQVVNTDYANDGGEFYQDIAVDITNGYWLRSPGTKDYHPAYVGLFGDSLIQTEASVHDTRETGKMRVRPVLHLDLSKTSVWTYAGRVTPDGKTVKEKTVTKLSRPTIKSAKNTSGTTVKVTLSKKVADATGYQVQYSLKSNFKSAKSKKFTGTSVNLTKLQKKKYYIRVRAYCKQNGKTIYSSWSKTKTVKVTGKASTSTTTFSTANYSLQIPGAWKGCYKTETFKDGDFKATAFYETLCNKEIPDCGWLFSISEYKDDSYLDMPSFEILGSKNGVTYVAVFPTDVQFEGASAKAQKQYQTLAGTVETVLKTFKLK